MDYDKAKDVATELERMTNVMGGGDEITYVSEKMTEIHRTLVQAFFGRFVIPFVSRLAEQYECGYYDARNECAGKMCSAMMKAVRKQYNLKEGDRIVLPFI